MQTLGLFIIPPVILGAAVLPETPPPSGQFILTRDENKVGAFTRLGDRAAVRSNEVRINYIRWGRGVTFGAPRYYFQNGTAETYENADHGIFKVSPRGAPFWLGWRI